MSDQVVCFHVKPVYSTISTEYGSKLNTQRLYLLTRIYLETRIYLFAILKGHCNILLHYVPNIIIFSKHYLFGH